MEEDDISYFYALGIFIPGAIFIVQYQLQEGVIMNQRSFNTKKIVLLAMFAAIAYVMVMAIRIPVVLFLSYEPKDVIITIGGFLFGPVAAAGISLLVALVEMVSISQTGPIGALMNFLSTCCFACTAALIYRKHRTRTGALLGLMAGSVAMIAVMLLWNWLITPLYMSVERSAVEGMLLPVFAPFNALKAGLNSAITLFIYKPLVSGLRKTGLLPPSEVNSSSAKPGLYLIAGLLLVSCILLFLALRGIL